MNSSAILLSTTPVTTAIEETMSRKQTKRQQLSVHDALTMFASPNRSKIETRPKTRMTEEALPQPVLKKLPLRKLTKRDTELLGEQSAKSRTKNPSSETLQQALLKQQFDFNIRREAD